MIVVDSSVWIDFFRRVDSPETSRLRGLLSLRDVVVGDIVLCEVLQGARNADQARRIERDLRMFEARSILGIDIASKAAANYRKLREIGITIRKLPDLIICTYCIEHDCPLLHNDRDFLPMVQHLGLREF